MGELNWNRLRHDGKLKEPAWIEEPEKLKGCWTHVERAPVRHVSIEEYLATTSDWPGDRHA